MDNLESNDLGFGNVEALPGFTTDLDNHAPDSSQCSSGMSVFISGQPLHSHGIFDSTEFSANDSLDIHDFSTVSVTSMGSQLGLGSLQNEMSALFGISPNSFVNFQSSSLLPPQSDLPLSVPSLVNRMPVYPFLQRNGMHSLLSSADCGIAISLGSSPLSIPGFSLPGNLNSDNSHFPIHSPFSLPYVPNTNLILGSEDIKHSAPTTTFYNSLSTISNIHMSSSGIKNEAVDDAWAKDNDDKLNFSDFLNLSKSGTNVDYKMEENGEEIEQSCSTVFDLNRTDDNLKQKSTDNEESSLPELKHIVQNSLKQVGSVKSHKNTCSEKESEGSFNGMATTGLANCSLSSFPCGGSSFTFVDGSHDKNNILVMQETGGHADTKTGEYLSVNCDSNITDMQETLTSNLFKKIPKLELGSPMTLFPSEETDNVLQLEADSFSGNGGDETLDPMSEVGMSSGLFWKDKLDINIHIEDNQCVMIDGQKRWCCALCPKMYSTKHNLITHILGHKGIKPHYCTVCGKFFKQISHLQTHMLTHGNMKPHMCKVCNRSFTQSSHVKRHMAVHMEQKPHVCQQCNRGFAYPNELKNHMDKHKTDSEHACDECGSTFGTVDKLRKHKAVEHRFSAALVCKECGKAFTYPSQLRDHSAKHSGTRPFICGECGLDFMKEHHLKAHMFTHTGLRPFACRLCERAFNQKANLRRHMLVHDGEKKYACEICGRGFTQHQILQAHIVTHQENKPFQCKVCGKGFSRLHNLNGHMHMHEGDRPYSCSCGAAFTLKGNLNRHKKDKHCSQGTEKNSNDTKDGSDMLPERRDSHEETDGSPTTLKKKRKSMPRKTISQDNEVNDDVDEEVAAAWQLTEDSIQEEEEEDEDMDAEDAVAEEKSEYTELTSVPNDCMRPDDKNFKDHPFESAFNFSDDISARILDRPGIVLVTTDESMQLQPMNPKQLFTFADLKTTCSPNTTSEIQNIGYSLQTTFVKHEQPDLLDCDRVFRENQAALDLFDMNEKSNAEPCELQSPPTKRKLLLDNYQKHRTTASFLPREEPVL